jgi:hypothetical protein
MYKNLDEINEHHKKIHKHNCEIDEKLKESLVDDMVEKMREKEDKYD